MLHGVTCDDNINDDGVALLNLMTMMTSRTSCVLFYFIHIFSVDGYVHFAVSRTEHRVALGGRCGPRRHRDSVPCLCPLLIVDCFGCRAASPHGGGALKLTGDPGAWPARHPALQCHGLPGAQGHVDPAGECKSELNLIKVFWEFDRIAVSSELATRLCVALVAGQGSPG